MANSRDPDIWHRMGAYIHQDFLLQYPDPIDGIEEFFVEEPKHERIELRNFLYEASTQVDRPGGMSELWLASQPGFFFADEHENRAFIDRIIALLDRISVL